MSCTTLREIKLMQAVRHTNVMGCSDVFVDGGSVHLVMEFMDSDLKKLIEDSSMSLSEAHVQCLSRQLLDGLRALHQRWFIHRDITPSNVLLSFATGVAKICDFGTARTIGHNNHKKLTKTVTTRWYRAPELLYGAQLYGAAVDIWSTGCVLAEMLLRTPLFKGTGEISMLTEIFEKRGTPTEEAWPDVAALPSYLEFPSHPSPPMADTVPGASGPCLSLLEGLLCLGPKKRLDVDTALGHEFFASVRCEPRQLPFVD